MNKKLALAAVALTVVFFQNCSQYSGLVLPRSASTQLEAASPSGAPYGDLVFSAGDPRWYSYHQVGCQSYRLAQDNVDGTWSVLPSGIPALTPGGPPAHPCGSAQTQSGGTPAGLYLTFGPYTTEVQPGTNVATFSLMAGATGASNDLATLDVYCDAQGKSIATRTVNYSDFITTYRPQEFGLTFNYDSIACPVLEFRVRWEGGGELHHISTTVGRPKDYVFYPGDTNSVGFPTTPYQGLLGPTNPSYTGPIGNAVVSNHQVGCWGDGMSWSVHPFTTYTDVCGTLQRVGGSAPAGTFMTYGPYTTALGGGVYFATFTLYHPTGPALVGADLQIYSDGIGAVLIDQAVGPNQFPADNVPYEFTIPFYYEPETHRSLEFRVQWDGGALVHQQTMVRAQIAPANLSCSTDTDCRRPAQGCVWAYDYGNLADSRSAVMPWNPLNPATVPTIPYVVRRDHSPYAASSGPWDAEGSPAPKSCANYRPFCVANTCQADPAPSDPGILIPSNFYLDHANNTPAPVYKGGLNAGAIDGSAKVGFNVLPDNTRTVTFNSACGAMTSMSVCPDPLDPPAPGAQFSISNMRNSPYHHWSGSYELPVTNPYSATTTPAYYFNLTFDPSSMWFPVNTGSGSSVLGGSYILLQPQVTDGYVANIWLVKSLPGANGFSTVTASIFVSYYPGDNILDSPSQPSRNWTLSQTDLPYTIHVMIQGGVVALVDSNGNPLTGVREDTNAVAPVSYYDSRMFDNVSNMDVNVFSATPVTLNQLTVTRRPH